jgi:hypothetical protein
MIVTKPQKPIKAIHPIMGIEATKPKPIKKTVHHRKFGSEVSAPKPKPIPEFGTGGYVAAMREQDHPTGSRSTTTPTTSSSNLTGCNIFNIDACPWM